MFQLKSMAQTRACAKALRNVLSFSVVLAGYAPVAAEEITGNEQPEVPSKPPVQQPVRKAEAPPSGAIISAAQAKRFYAIWKGAGKTQTDVQAKLKQVIGTESDKAIPRDKYEDLCAWAQGGEAQE